MTHRQDVHMHGQGAEAETGLEELEQVVTNIQDPETAAVYRRHRYAIARRHVTLGPMHEVYNFPVLNGVLSLETLMEMVEQIFSDRAHPFRLNFALGFILESVTSGEPARFFHPYRNVHELERYVNVSSHRDLDALRRRLERTNFEERIMAQRPSSSWSVSLVTNVRFEVSDISLTQPLGCRGVQLPAFIVRKAGLMDFPRRPDNLCFFRCLAHYLGAERHEVDEYARKFFFIWKGEEADVAGFEGVEDSDLQELEDLFQVNVTIFCLQPDYRAETVRASPSSHGRTMYLNVFDGHLSHVAQPEQFSYKYVCSICSMTFPRVDAKTTHERVCRGGGDSEEMDGNIASLQDRRYVGGYFKQKLGIFQRLREVLVPVEEAEED